MNKDLPRNTAAEKAIFSIILTNPDRFLEVADKLEARDFYHIYNQEIWQTMSGLFSAGKEIDVVSIKTELQKRNLDYKVALKQLSSCYDEVVFESNLLGFVKEIKNKSLLRQIIGTLRKHKEDAGLDEAEALRILTEIEKDVVNLSERVHDDRPVSAGGILNEVRVDIARGQHGKWKGFNTGFKKLDVETGGLLPTHSWIVGAYTGQGKTFFLLQIILNVLEQGAKVVLFSTEMDRKMNMLRMLGNLAGLGTINILKGNLDEEEKEKLLEAEKILVTYKRNLTIYDNVYTVEEIRLKAKKQKMRNGLDIVIVDFIQNLRGDSNIYDRMSNAATGLQRIAHELEVTMVLASQVTQSSAGWTSKEAIEYKGAGEIAAIADVGLWIKSRKEDMNVRQVILRKMRHGRSNRSFDVRISFPSGRVVEVEEGPGEARARF